MAWRRVATTKNLSPENPFPFAIDEKQFAIFQVNTNYYALDNICPHAYALMTDGFVEDDKVECPLHGAIFHIPTGKCLGPPADADLKTYPVKVEDDVILVDV